MLLVPAVVVGIHETAAGFPRLEESVAADDLVDVKDLIIPYCSAVVFDVAADTLHPKRAAGDVVTAGGYCHSDGFEEFVPDHRHIADGSWW